MSCINGQTFVNTLIPAPGATAADATYAIDLTHYTCGNRKICANGAFPLTADLKYSVIGTPRPVGNDTFICDILIAGTLTYVPHRCGQNQCGCPAPCPVTENIWTTVSVPVAAATIPTLTAGDVIASPTNLRDCCNITNAVSLVSSFNVAAAAAAAADNGSKSK